MKFELVWENVSDFVMRFVLLVFCGGFLSSVGLIVGGGLLAVYVLHFPTYGIRVDAVITLYGIGAFLLFHCITRFWLIREGLNEWDSLGAMHRDAVASLKR